MSREDDPLDDEPRRLTHVIYNTALGHVRVRAEDGPATTVEVPPGEVRFRRLLGTAEPEVALWLGSGEREYLERMLDHVLRALRITPEARAALEAVRVKLDELGPPPVLASDGTDGAAEAASVPLVEEPPPPPPTEPAAGESRPTRSRSRTTPRATRPDEPASEPAGEPVPEPTSDAGTPPAAASAVPANAEPEATIADEPATAEAPAEVAAGATDGAEDDFMAPGAIDALEAASQAAFDAAVAADGSGEPITFEQVWRDLGALQARGPALQTLAGQASSEIREVVENGIWLYSNGLAREYLIERRSLEGAWAALVKRGHLVPRELRGGMSYGAATLLAHLPYVEYSAEPVTLYYPAANPHPLGTVHRRDV
ncbi:MAG TPA: hypothetical protein VII06_43395 [Chloroflexota bacterium]|jgi:hypothetical protein